jgi:hypothetical protein
MGDQTRPSQSQSSGAPDELPDDLATHQVAERQPVRLYHGARKLYPSARHGPNYPAAWTSQVLL